MTEPTPTPTLGGLLPGTAVGKAPPLGDYADLVPGAKVEHRTFGPGVIQPGPWLNGQVLVMYDADGLRCWCNPDHLSTDDEPPMKPPQAYAIGFYDSRVPQSVTCPKCGATSSNPDDVSQGYCGRCHDWTSDPT